jgi:hypothetical protein
MTAPPQKKSPGAVAAANRAEGSGQSAAIVPQSRYAQKRFATLRALAALRGIALYRADDGVYIASRWGLIRELPALDDVAAFLEQQEARA